jgi:hypothetical protein
LRWGHRQSEDIDLFSNIVFDEWAVTEVISHYFSDTIILAQDKQTVRLFSCRCWCFFTNKPCYEKLPLQISKYFEILQKNKYEPRNTTRTSF